MATFSLPADARASVRPQESAMASFERMPWPRRRASSSSMERFSRSAAAVMLMPVGVGAVAGAAVGM
jgi:hypothetical protein